MSASITYENTVPLEFGLRLAQGTGLRIFPCVDPRTEPLTGDPAKDKGRGKRPVAGLKWRDEASNDPAQIKEWMRLYPSANFGLAWPEGVLAIDIDGEPGAEWIAGLEAANGPVPDTLGIITARGGHLVFSLPVGAQIPNRTNVAPGIDLRGHGAYSVGPGSRSHQEGVLYGHHDRPILEIPIWLWDALIVATEKPKPAPSAVSWSPVSSDELTPYQQGLVERAPERIASRGQGSRNSGFNDDVFACASFGVPRDLVEATLKAAGLQCGMGEREIEGTFESAWTAGLANPRDPRGPDFERGLRIDPAPAAALKRPPASEVAELWASAERATDDHRVVAWLRFRGFSPERIDDLSRRDLVRALPEGLVCPSWARFGRPWSETHYRALFALWGPTGEIESLRARSLDPNSDPKSVHPSGGGNKIKGLVLADLLGAALLRGETWAVARAKANGVTILEGDIDFLVGATSMRVGDDRAPAIFGVSAGAWAAEIASRIPDGARVRVGVHDDGAGRDYAQGIADSLAGRCAVVSLARRNNHG